MKMICRYREFSKIETLPSVKDNISNLTDIEKAKILRHLKKSKECLAGLVSVDDAFTGKHTNLEFITYTDGEYGWSTEEIYHFEKYNIKLDDEFISKVLNQDESLND